MSTDDLAAQVAAIKPGDTVTARFDLRDHYPWTVTGRVRIKNGAWLVVGPDNVISRGDGQPTEYLMAIESHEPAKPPVPPEPEGDYLLREPSGQVSAPVDSQPGVLMRQDDGARLYWDTLVYYHGADVKIYRPEPSPERIEELVQRFIRKPVVHDAGWLRSFVGQLLWGDE